MTATEPTPPGLTAADAEWFDHMAAGKRAAAEATDTPAYAAQLTAEAAGLEALAASLRDPAARALPALLRAEKLQKRAARDGFDWPDAEGPAAKLAEEAAELRAATAEERKRMLRLVVREVVLDQKRERGLVWMHIAWQTGATSEHRLRRSVQGYAHYAGAGQLERRVRELNAAGMMDREIAATLNADGMATAHGTPFAGENVHLCRKRWGIPTVKINGVDANPPRWPDGSYSVQGAAAALGVAEQTVFKWLRKRRLDGRQLTKGQPWQITLPDDRITKLAAQVRRTSRSTKEAS